MEASQQPAQSVRDRIKRWESKSSQAQPTTGRKIQETGAPGKVNRRRSIKTEAQEQEKKHAEVNDITVPSSGTLDPASEPAPVQGKIADETTGKPIVETQPEAHPPSGYTQTVHSTHPTSEVQAQPAPQVLKPAVIPQTPADQREALMQLFESTNGRYWRHNEGWGTPVAVSAWYGVTCDLEGNVTRLRLGNNNLESTLRLISCFGLVK